MAQFAVVDGESQLEEERFDTVEKAIESATKDVTDNPDTEVEIVQFVKRVSSSLKVDVEDA